MNMTASTPAPVPTNVWINAAGKQPHDWIVERMTSANIAADGSFEMEASDGKVMVERGFAVFQANEQVYACLPRFVQDKLALAVGADNDVVADLTSKSEMLRAKKPGARPKRSVASEKPLCLKPMIGAPCSPQFAIIDTLEVDDTYQRSIEGGASRTLITKIAENWDWRLCLPLLVSRRGAKMFVIDGQHRFEAAKLRGDIAHLPVVIFDFDDARSEAELFVQANRSRRNMSVLDDFHAAVVAGDKKAIAVNEVVLAAGLSVGRNQAWQHWKANEVVFTKAIQNALGSAGKAVVERALSMIANAFPGEVLTGGGAIFTALCNLLRQREEEGDPIKPDLMELVLAETGLLGWKDAVEDVSSGAERSEAMLKALEKAYVEAEDA